MSTSDQIQTQSQLATYTYHFRLININLFIQPNAQSSGVSPHRGDRRVDRHRSLRLDDSKAAPGSAGKDDASPSIACKSVRV